MRFELSIAPRSYTLGHWRHARLSGSESFGDHRRQRWSPARSVVPERRHRVKLITAAENGHIKQTYAAPPRQYRTLRPRPMQRQIICDASAARGVSARAPPVSVCTRVLWSASSPNWPAVTHLITARADGPRIWPGEHDENDFPRVPARDLRRPPGERG